MIPARRGLAARFKITDRTGEGKHAYSSLPVEAWSDDGGALVVGEKSGDLERADNYGNFVGVCEETYPEIVALIPAGAWRVEHTDKAGAEPWSEPLVAWGLSVDGAVYPIASDGNGDTEVLEHTKHSTWRVYHPETTEVPGMTETDSSAPSRRGRVN